MFFHLRTRCLSGWQWQLVLSVSFSEVENVLRQAFHRMHPAALSDEGEGDSGYTQAVCPA